MAVGSCLLSCPPARVAGSTLLGILAQVLSRLVPQPFSHFPFHISHYPLPFPLAKWKLLYGQHTHTHTHSGPPTLRCTFHKCGRRKTISCCLVACAFAKVSASYVGCPSTQLLVCAGNYGPPLRPTNFPPFHPGCRKYLPLRRRYRCKHVASLTLRLTWRDVPPRSWCVNCPTATSAAEAERPLGEKKDDIRRDIIVMYMFHKRFGEHLGNFLYKEKGNMVCKKYATRTIL